MHRLDARSKLFIALVYSVCLFFDDTWASLGISALVFVAALIASKVPVSKMLKASAIVYVLVAITILCNSFSFRDSSMQFSIEGFLAGLFFGVRILLLVWASLIVCFTTTTEQVNATISSMLSPLRAFRVPVDDVAMTFSIAIRFLPQTAAEFASIRDAQWSRGAAFDSGSLFDRIKAHASILLPMVVNLFRRSDALATAMDSRCYGMPGVRRGALSKPRMGVAEWAVCIVSCAAIIANAVFL